MPAPRKERERTLRREVLIEAAERVFGRKPFDEATMQEVAREAEIGMQGLYEQFPSKQELYEQMLPEHRAERRRQEDFDSCGESVVTLSEKGERHVA